MSQCISLSTVWHLSSLLPSMGCSLLFGCHLAWWCYCSQPALTTATLWKKQQTVCRPLYPPPPCLALSFSFALWVRQPGLFTAWWIPYREPPLFLKWIQPSPLYRCLQIARILLPHHFLFVLYSCISCLSAWMALFDEHTQNRCFGLRMDTLMCFCSVIRISRH